jgi:hypothetical protein
LAYRVRLDPHVQSQLRDAPPQLQGFVAGIIAFPWVDPSGASVAFPVIVGEDYRTIVFADGHGFLDYEMFEEQQLVVIDELTWLES